MKVVSFDQIVNANITPIQCFEWVEEVLKHKSEAILPPKISLKPGISGVFYNIMPSIIGGANCGGVKLVTRYPERSPSLDSTILLYEIETGKNVALVDGNWITAMRTGAVAAHSIKLFAIQEFKELGFIGLGNTARATLDILVSVFPNKKLKIKLKKYKNHHELFVQRFNKENSNRYRNLSFEFCETYDEVVQNSDVVVSAVTILDEDICSNECFKQGVLVVPIHTRGFTNCDLFFDKVFADDLAHVRGFKYFNNFKSFAEVSAVVNGNKRGRENDKERILAYNIGISLHDIYYAKKLYDICKDSCETLELNTPEAKFWV